MTNETELPVIEEFGSAPQRQIDGEARGERQKGALPGSPGNTARCDLCGELYNLRHSYEVLHHLHGRRFEDCLAARH